MGTPNLYEWKDGCFTISNHLKLVAYRYLGGIFYGSVLKRRPWSRGFSPSGPCNDPGLQNHKEGQQEIKNEPEVLKPTVFSRQKKPEGFFGRKFDLIWFDVCWFLGFVDLHDFFVLIYVDGFDLGKLV